MWNALPLSTRWAQEGSGRFLGYPIIARISNQITGLLSLLQSED